MEDILQQKHIGNRTAGNGQQHLAFPLMQGHRDDDADDFGQAVIAGRKRDVFEAVDDEHGKNGAGQGPAEILDVVGRRLFGGKDEKRQEASEHRAESTHGDGDDLFRQGHLDSLPFERAADERQRHENADHRGNDEGLTAKNVQTDERCD